jgi:hypothetical protein
MSIVLAAGLSGLSGLPRFHVALHNDPYMSQLPAAVKGGLLNFFAMQ